MNSFRVVDTRFRILKGGKIGLSLSISLLAGIMILGSIKSFATDYFGGVTTSTSNIVNGITVQTATNSNPSTKSVEITGTSTSDDVVFAPTSWANSFYTTPTYDSTYGGVGNPTYLINRTNDYLELNLTLSNGADAKNISKNTTTIYTAPILPNVVFAPSTITLPLTPDASSKDYTANLIFKGANTVSGNTDIGDGNIKLDGGATFTGTVNAGSIDVDTASTVTFNGAVDLTLDPTKDLKFNQSGDIVLNSDLKGDVTLTANNQGTITTTGATQTITGNIGTSDLNDLGTLNIGSTTNPTNHSTTTIDGNVFANSTVLNNNGTTNSSELILSSGKYNYN